MGNMIKNRLTINGTEANINEIFNWIIGENNIDKNYPPEIVTLNREYLRSKYGSLHPGFPIDGEWTRDSWGDDFFGMVISRSNTTVVFATKSIPLVTFIMRISMLFPIVEFQYEYANEDYGSKIGNLIIQDGNIMSDNTPSEASDEAFKFVISVWGEDWRSCIEATQYGEQMPLPWDYKDLIEP